MMQPVPEDLEALLCEISGVRCALPLDAVREVFSPEAVTPVPGTPAIVGGLSPLRGRVLPVVDLGSWFGRAAGLGGRPADSAVAVEAPLPGEAHPVHAAFLVDRIVRVETVKRDGAGGPPTSTPVRPGLSNGRLGDGTNTVVVVIDVPDVLAEVRRATLEVAGGLR